MKRNLFFCGGLVFAAFSLNAFAAPGEYWEITSQMDMPGMPMAMPAQKVKVCLPTGGQGDPRQTQKDCTFSDVQQSGNTVKFKGTCVNDRGDKMKVSGETTHDSNSFKTKMQMSGDGGGRPMNMSMNSSGKRVGGGCDTDEMRKNAQAQEARARGDLNKMKAESCDFTKSGNLYGNAGLYFGPQPMCTNQKEYCQAVRDKAQRDVASYQGLLSQVEQEKQYGANTPSLVKTCNLDVAGIGKAVCKNSVHRGPQNFMDKNCSPAEAKEYREYARKQACGREYTAPDDLKACLKGEKVGRSYTADEEAVPEKTKQADAAKSKTDTVLDGAKKLKGLLHF